MRSGRHRRRHRLRARTFGVAPLAVALVLVPTDLDSLPPPVHVSLDGSIRTVPPGSTLAEASDFLGLRPRRGALLDVEGRVLRRREFEGHVLVNGVPGSPARVLEEGDRLEVVDAEDRTEPTVREVVEVEEGTPPDPQTHLGSVPGELVIVRGEISRKIVSSEFRPSGPAEQPDAVALTFDDGPSPGHTLRIARILRRSGAVGTFFTIGYLVERYPDVVLRLSRLGMQVGNHSHNHPYDRPFAHLSSAQIESQIATADRALAEVGVDSGLFRPPGGSWSPRTVQIASEAGSRTVLWSVDSRDWTGLTPAQIASGVLGAVGPGSIVLLHDGGGNRRATVRALPRILRGLRRMGLATTTL